MITQVLITGALLTTFGQPYLPADMHLEYMMQGPYSKQVPTTSFVYSTSTAPLYVVFPDDGSGIVSRAVFADKNGNEVMVQVPNAQYNSPRFLADPTTYQPLFDLEAQQLNLKIQ